MDCRVVVNDQHQRSAIQGLGHSGIRTDGYRQTRMQAIGLECGDLSGKAGDESRALSREALGRDFAAHHAAEFLTDCQPEARSAIFPRGRIVCLSKRPEEFTDLLWAHADAGIDDLKKDPL